VDRLGDEVRAELSRFGPQAGLSEVVEGWPAAVGEAIARNAWPARIARDGTVHVNTSDSVWAFELAHRAAEIATRLGVPKVRFAPGPLPEHAPVEASRASVSPTPEHERAAAEIAAAVTDEDLRKSVQRVVSFSLARPLSDRPV
jgi:predicted nucleic acid-binding Zn ribbon protein